MKGCRSPCCRALALATALSVTGFPSGAGESSPPVDLALVLAVDVSSSMNASEQRAQRDGYVGAFRDRDVLGAIASGPRGRIAVTYVEWAGSAYQLVQVPWTVIGGPGDAAAFADRLAAGPLSADRGTSLSGGLAFAAALFVFAPAADRAVIDVSGDGPNNTGPAVMTVRDAIIEGGIAINGLAITLPRDGTSDFADAFGAGFVAAYYEDCVIGGPGAFVIAVDHAAKFADAIREKLVLEIAGRPARLMHAAYRPVARQPVDCATTGERVGR